MSPLWQSSPSHVHLENVRAFAVISDVHLDEPTDSRTQQFIATLRALPPVDHLFLVGDIFDFIFVRSIFYLNMWQSVFAELSLVSARGTKVIFIEGNHDFGFSLPLKDSLSGCFAESGDLVVTFDHAALGRVMVRHGDDIVCKDSYLSFRALVKSTLFQRLTSWIPGFVMHEIFSRWARISRARGEHRQLTGNFFSSSIQSRVGKAPTPPDLLILGHVHEFIDARVGTIRCLASPDWITSPSILHCSESGSIVRTFADGKVLPLFRIPESP